MKSAITPCCSNSDSVGVKKTTSFKNGFMSFVSSALIIILPKCPFCVAAYSGAILMFFNIENQVLVPFFFHGKPFLGFTIILLILLNYTKEKSKIALSISITSFITLLLVNYANIRLVPNWIIYTGFLFAVWYNGNFRYFYNFIKTSKLSVALKK